MVGVQFTRPGSLSHGKLFCLNAILSALSAVPLFQILSRCPPTSTFCCSLCHSLFVLRYLTMPPPASRIKALAGALFFEADTNKDGFIDLPELTQCLREVEPTLSDYDIQEIFKIMDSNKEGKGITRCCRLSSVSCASFLMS